MKRLTNCFLPILLLYLILSTGCKEETRSGMPARKPATAQADSGFILIASDINYDVIVNPPEEIDPWETERVSGYNGNIMVEDIFEKIYSGTLKAYDMISGEPLSPSDVKKLEEEMNSAGKGVAKIQFTEDWYYDPDTSEIKKIVKSIIMGYEFRDSQGIMFGHRALFKLILAE
ncbi:MAG: hypothetical protein R6W67_07770 [Bacteroidales bacterium]